MKPAPPLFEFASARRPDQQGKNSSPAARGKRVLGSRTCPKRPPSFPRWSSLARVRNSSIAVSTTRGSLFPCGACRQVFRIRTRRPRAFPAQEKHGRKATSRTLPEGFRLNVRGKQYAGRRWFLEKKARRHELSRPALAYLRPAYTNGDSPIPGLAWLMA